MSSVHALSPYEAIHEHDIPRSQPSSSSTLSERVVCGENLGSRVAGDSQPTEKTVSYSALAHSPRSMAALISAADLPFFVIFDASKASFMQMPQ